MAFVAPWLRAADPIAAMRAGADLGLDMRRQDQQEQSAADQLRLAQDQMWEQRQRAQESLQERRGEAAAKLAQASAQMALQAGHYADAKEMQKASQALTASHYKALEEASNRRLDLMESQGTEGMNEDGTYTANPVNDVFGNQVGNKLPRMSGFHPTRQSADMGASASILSAQLKTSRELAADTNADPVERMQAAARVQALAPLLDKKIGIDLVPNLQTNTVSPWFGPSRQEVTTNSFSPRSAASALEPSATPLPPRPAPTAQRPETQLANQIASEHPDWDRPKILAEVRRLMSGGR